MYGHLKRLEGAEKPEVTSQLPESDVTPEVDQPGQGENYYFTQGGGGLGACS